MIHGSHPSVTRRAIRVLVFAQLALSPLVFSPQLADAFELPKTLLLWLVALALAALGLSAALPSADSGSRLTGETVQRWLREPLQCGIALFIVSALFSCLFSISPRVSMRGMPESHFGCLTILAYGVLFFSVQRSFRDSAQRRRLLLAAILATVGVCAYGLLQCFHADPLRWDHASKFHEFWRPCSTLGHPNHLGAFLVMTLPLVLVYFRRDHGSDASRAWIPWLLQWILMPALALASICLIIVTLSRGAWLGIAIAAAVLLLGLPWKTFRWRLASLAGLAVVAVVLVGAVKLLLPDNATATTVSERFVGLIQPAGRQYIWAGSWHLFLDRPWLGYGPETLQLVYGKYRSPDSWWFEPHATPTKAHNQLLNILVSQGLLGLVALGLIIAGIVRVVPRVVRQQFEKADAERRLSLALVAGLSGYAVTLLFSFNVAGCATVAVIFVGVLAASFAEAKVLVPQRGIPLGSVTHARETINGAWSHVRWLAPVAVLAAEVYIAGTILVPLYRASAACHEAQAHELGNPQRAVKCLQQACDLQPANDHYRIKLAEALGREADCASDRTEQLDCRRAACAAARQALDLEPESPPHQAMLARQLGLLALAKVCDAHEAIAAFDAAVAADANNADTLFDAIRNALALEDPVAADRFLTLALNSYPECVTFQVQRGLWLIRRGDDVAGMELVRRAWTEDWGTLLGMKRDTFLAAAEDLLHLKRFCDAECVAGEAVRDFPSSAPLHLALAGALVMQGRYREAQDEYQRVMELEPNHGIAREALARLRRLGPAVR